MPKENVNIVWLKRDLRLRDHAPLAAAVSDGLPCLLIYAFEPSLLRLPESDVRHWRFVWESLEDLQRQLAAYNQRITICHGEVLPIFEQLQQQFQIQHLFAHQETGQKITFDRDRTIKQFCQSNGITYQEFVQDGVQRGLSHRQDWQARVDAFFNAEVQRADLSQLQSCTLPLDLERKIVGPPLPQGILHSAEHFQRGGERLAWRYFSSFLDERVADYSRQLSKPALSRRSCSRLSTYLAYGCISAREVWQYSEQKRRQGQQQWNIENFQSRLWWRTHYIQKLESEWQVEFEPINKALCNIDRHQNREVFEAWASGHTGIPMVDASMRSLIATGWLNFRMRAMLATFATFSLWLDWRMVATHLAQVFLDYDPGIHFPQLQMQAGLTGYHQLRIFNPIHQAREHDPEGIFIKTWVPELAAVPGPLCGDPWNLPPMEQRFYQFELGRNYPAPIVDYDTVTRKNRDHYWQFRQQPGVANQLPLVWRRHCIPEDIQKYKTALPLQ